MLFKVLGIAHFAVATPKFQPMMEAFEKAFGSKLEDTEDVPEQKVRTAFTHIGGVPFEFLEPLSNDSPITKFLEKRGSGIHHVAIRVDNILNAIADLKTKGFIFIDEAPRDGAHGMKTAFLHPKSFHGILVELVE